MRPQIFLLLATLLIGGCAGHSTVSKNQCAAGDWQTLGYRDGVNGHRSSRLLDHQDACMKQDIVPDRADYMLGWNEGVREYCQPNNGFSVGEHGWAHNNICPSDMRADFQHAWKEGRSLYQARAEVANLERELDRRTARLTEVKSQIVSVAAAQLNGDLTATERIDLATRVQRLYEEKEHLKVTIPDVEAELAFKSRELDRLSRTLAVVTY